MQWIEVQLWILIGDLNGIRNKIRLCLRFDLRITRKIYLKISISISISSPYIYMYIYMKHVVNSHHTKILSYLGPGLAPGYKLLSLFLNWRSTAISANFISCSGGGNVVKLTDTDSVAIMVKRCPINNEQKTHTGKNCVQFFSSPERRSISSQFTLS